ncbi:MAG: hypothetical protein ACFB5Z_17825 [Elainellaceae cyanobacterium]
MATAALAIAHGLVDAVGTRGEAKSDRMSFPSFRNIRTAGGMLKLFHQQRLPAQRLA